MAQKTYIKGLGKRCDNLAKYITKFELDQTAQVGVNPDLTSTIQAQAAILLAAANIVKAQPTAVYREQA